MSERTVYGVSMTALGKLTRAQQTALWEADSLWRLGRIVGPNGEAPTRRGAVPGAPSSSGPATTGDPRLVRRLRDLGLSGGDLDDLLRLEADELERILPTAEDLDVLQSAGPAAPSVAYLIVQKAKDAGVKLPPDFAKASAQ